MRIGIDIDGVLADFFPTLLNYYNSKYNRNDKIEDFKDYKWWPIWEISKEEAIRRVDEFHKIHKLKDISPIKGSIEAINELANYNELFIITARPKEHQNKAESWIRHHFKKEIKIIHSGDFHEEQAKSKAEICEELNIDLMIEDGANSAKKCAEKGIKVILFDSHQNQSISSPLVTRVKSWKEALKAIKDI